MTIILSKYRICYRIKLNNGNLEYTAKQSVFLRIQARAVKHKVWNEAENRERDWEETLKIRFFSSRLTRLRACEAPASRA